MCFNSSSGNDIRALLTRKESARTCVITFGLDLDGTFRFDANSVSFHPICLLPRPAPLSSSIFKLSLPCRSPPRKTQRRQRLQSRSNRVLEDLRVYCNSAPLEDAIVGMVASTGMNC
ncbi:hypothetical protein PIB30_006118 [Stylosanthes scabra]|uniref:Uncharacterized protein n=1 Tax=Stylosanthes scabra TaxID=79078 RepID=A0ABU6W2B5_9FABA|nr:hypothetical protein [Stylosanthes scabra]